MLNIISYAQSIEGFVPQDFEISQIVKGHLNADTLTDCAFILHKLNESDTQQL